MTPKEAFKIGFLEKCAEDGLSDEEIVKRIRNSKMMTKLALGGAGMADDTIGGVFNFFGNVLDKAWPMFLVGPPLAGAAGGYVLSQAKNDAYDKDEAKTREIVGAYQQALTRLHAMKKKQEEQKKRRLGR